MSGHQPMRGGLLVPVSRTESRRTKPSTSYGTIILMSIFFDRPYKPRFIKSPGPWKISNQ